MRATSGIPGGVGQEIRAPETEGPVAQLEVPKLAQVTQNWPPIVRYACTLGIVALITVLEFIMWTGSSYPFVLSIVAVIASAALFGQWAGIFATILSAVISTYFFVAPLHSLNLKDAEELLALTTFIEIGLLSSVVVNEFYRPMDHLSRANTELSIANNRLKNYDEEKI